MLVTRSITLDATDIAIRSDGTGRTVEAYAAVFNQATEILDQEGHYREQLAPTAFNRALANKALRFGVFYNHAKTLSGAPSDTFSMPLGSPVEIRPDGKGLLTAVRYNNTPLADQVLEAIRNGDLTGMSWSGGIIGQDTRTPRGGFRPGVDGSLTLVTRTEIALREFGPTPFPAYGGAEILSVRAAG